MGSRLRIAPAAALRAFFRGSSGPHHRLAAHFERPFVGNGKREAVQRERLRGDVLPLDAVAARGGAHEGAVFISEAHREPVELVFDGIGRVCRLPNAREEGGELVFRDRLIEAIQPRDVPVPLEALDGLAAHPPRGGIGQHDARRPLKLAKLIVEPVVLAVLHRGRVQHIVFICPSVEDPDEFLHTFVHDMLPEMNFRPPSSKRTFGKEMQARRGERGFAAGSLQGSRKSRAASFVGRGGAGIKALPRQKEGQAKFALLRRVSDRGKTQARHSIPSPLVQANLRKRDASKTRRARKTRRSLLRGK